VQALAVMVLWPLGAFALLATRWAADVPDAVAVSLLVVAIARGLRVARALRRAPPGTLELSAGGRARWTPGETRGGRPRAPVEGAALAHEQWPVTTVRFAPCGTTVAFWPDTLCGPGRRLLRRWARSARSDSSLPQFWMG
jgi:hypothetical protein